MDDTGNWARSPSARGVLRWRRDLASLGSDLLPLCDCACLLLALPAAQALAPPLLPAAGAASAPGLANAGLVAAVLGGFLLYDSGFGTRALRAQHAALARRYLLRFLRFTLLVLALGYASGSLDAAGAAGVALWLTLCLALTSLTRVSMARILLRLGAAREVIALVGAGAAARQVQERLRHGEGQPPRVLGLFSDNAADAASRTGSIARLFELSRQRHIDRVLIAAPEASTEQLAALLHRLRPLGVPLALCPRNVGLRLPEPATDYLGGELPVALLAQRPIRRWNLVLKGAEDYLLGGLIVLLLLPVFAVLALAIRLDSPGPILFRQRRHTFNNREFVIYKFRTMQWSPPRADEKFRQTARGDSRVTRIGRWLRVTSLDELPQLFNVLRGEMSLVGPRPHAVDMRTEDRLCHEIVDVYTHRHRVKPGITGWSQVHGSRGATDTAEQLRQRVLMDLYYVEHWSLWLDLRILVMTVRTVLSGANAF